MKKIVGQFLYSNAYFEVIKLNTNSSKRLQTTKANTKKVNKKERQNPWTYYATPSEHKYEYRCSLHQGILKVVVGKEPCYIDVLEDQDPIFRGAYLINYGRKTERVPFLEANKSKWISLDYTGAYFHLNDIESNHEIAELELKLIEYKYAKYKR